MRHLGVLSCLGIWIMLSVENLRKEPSYAMLWQGGLANFFISGTHAIGFITECKNAQHKLH